MLTNEQAKILVPYCQAIGRYQIWDLDLTRRIAEQQSLTTEDCFKIICRLHISLLRLYHNFDDDALTAEMVSNRYSKLFVLLDEDKEYPFEVAVRWRKDISLRLHSFFPFTADEIKTLEPFVRQLGARIGGPLAKSLQHPGRSIRVEQVGSVLEKLASSLWYKHAKGDADAMRGWLTNGKYDMFKAVRTQEDADALCSRCFVDWSDIDSFVFDCV